MNTTNQSIQGASEAEAHALGSCGGNCAICRHATKAASDFTQNPLAAFVSAATKAA